MATSVSSPPPINPHEFISTLGPSLSVGNVEQALACVRTRWTACQIIALLKDKSCDVRKVAALALSLVGDASAIHPLAVALHDTDPMVTSVAEHALWSIWFRIGKPRAVALVKCGNTHLHHGNYVCALEKFSHAIQEDDTFAEAYNQRAIAHYLSERFDESIADCKAALKRIPQHFGAMSGMGHCHSHLGQWREAKHCYRLALAIHPRLEGIEGSLHEIERLLG
ncbi:MAG TPA: HEAT repeat domain-containing protein [Phycisphaerae bacterium]|nr:HEAT repeat domain-containing protein [Phycisphaerae bacterium]